MGKEREGKQMGREGEERQSVGDINYYIYSLPVPDSLHCGRQLILHGLDELVELALLQPLPDAGHHLLHPRLDLLPHRLQPLGQGPRVQPQVLEEVGYAGVSGGMAADVGRQ